jgi:hypothetical protein
MVPLPPYHPPCSSAVHTSNMCLRCVVISGNIQGFLATIWSHRKWNTWVCSFLEHESNDAWFRFIGWVLYVKSTNVNTISLLGLIQHCFIWSGLYGSYRWLLRNLWCDQNSQHVTHPLWRGGQHGRAREVVGWKGCHRGYLKVIRVQLKMTVAIWSIITTNFLHVD